MSDPSYFIQSTLISLGEEGIKQPFFIIDFGISYTTDISSVPIEVCVKPFILDPNSDEIIDFHAIINEEVPEEYKMRAKHHSEFEHGINRGNNPSTPTDFRKLWFELNDFISNSTKEIGAKFRPIIISLSFRRTIQCIEYIATKAGQRQFLESSAFASTVPFEEFVKFFYGTEETQMPIDALSTCLKPVLVYPASTKFKCEFHKNVDKRSFCCCKSNAAFLAIKLTTEYNPYNTDNILSTQKKY